VATKERRRTSTIQVSPSLNLVITKYATEQNITKAEAADRVFNILYPKGMGRETEASLAPPTSEAGDDSVQETGSELGLEEEEEEGEEISKELTNTVKDLRAVQTIKALTGNLSGKDDDRITAKDALELRKIEAMYGPKGGAAPGTEALDATFRKYLEPIQDQVKALEAKISEQRVADAEKRASDAEKKLEEISQREQRQAEFQALLGPMQDKMTELGMAIGTLKSESEPPTSEELKAINALAIEMRNMVQKLGQAGSGGEGKQGLADTIDQLTTLIDKIQGIQSKFKGGGEGDFDWRAASISTVGEVATEALRTFRDIHEPVLGPEDEGGGGEAGDQKKEEVGNQVVLRRVYNHAVKKISEGQLQLNPYDTAKELNLTPNQVWWAVDTLRKRGLLKAEQQSSGTKQEGEVEHGRGTEGVAELPPGVEA